MNFNCFQSISSVKKRLIMLYMFYNVKIWSYILELFQTFEGYYSIELNIFQKVFIVTINYINLNFKF